MTAGAEVDANRDDAPVVVLAAGRGERVGTPKGLVMVDGAPWLERQLASLASRRVPRVIVVLGHDVPAHVRAMPWLERALAEGETRLGVLVVATVNPAPERGPFSSLRCGLARLGADDATFVLPVDVACPARATWGALRGALSGAFGGARLAAVPVRAGRGGHPVLLAARFVARLAAVPIDAAEARLDVQLRALTPEEIARVETDDARAFSNLNTKEDWARAAAADEGDA